MPGLGIELDKDALQAATLDAIVAEGTREGLVGR
jgi:hypothetical protein